MQGGAVQGIGWALNEEYVYNDKGEMTNASFLDYRMPTALDLPMIDTVIVEVPNPGHPYGVRGVGEVPIVPPPAAHRQRDLPRHRRAHGRAADVAGAGGESHGQVALRNASCCLAIGVAGCQWDNRNGLAKRWMTWRC